MTTKDIVKTGLSIIVGVGVTTLVGGFLKSNTRYNGGVVTSICTKLGAFALEGVAATTAIGYIVKLVDDVWDGIDKFRSNTNVI